MNPTIPPHHDGLSVCRSRRQKPRGGTRDNLVRIGPRRGSKYREWDSGLTNQLPVGRLGHLGRSLGGIPRL